MPIDTVSLEQLAEEQVPDKGLHELQKGHVKLAGDAGFASQQHANSDANRATGQLSTSDASGTSTRCDLATQATGGTVERLKRPLVPA